MSRDEIAALFRAEFGDVASRFTIVDCIVCGPPSASACQPGIYVFWKEGRVIKVGRSLKNAWKRALEHMDDNTAGSMQSLRDDPNCHVLLYTIDGAQPHDVHWIVALEVFFEQQLKPQIRSRRLA